MDYVHDYPLVAGTIWARYSLVIIPINYNLFAVNVFVAITGFSQLYRIWRYIPSTFHYLLCTFMQEILLPISLFYRYQQKIKDSPSPPAEES